MDQTIQGEKLIELNANVNYKINQLFKYRQTLNIWQLSTSGLHSNCHQQQIIRF